jgi:hypothetical protein
MVFPPSYNSRSGERGCVAFNNLRRSLQFPVLANRGIVDFAVTAITFEVRGRARFELKAIANSEARGPLATSKPQMIGQQSFSVCFDNVAQQNGRHWWTSKSSLAAEAFNCRAAPEPCAIPLLDFSSFMQGCHEVSGPMVFDRFLKNLPYSGCRSIQ